MHISEGIMTLPVLSTGWAVTAGLLALSLRRINSAGQSTNNAQGRVLDSMLPKMAVFASAFFLASLVRVPIGATSAHFALLGLMGLTLGWGSFPAIFMALVLQALLFQFGGLASLGVNACIMGIPALLTYALFSRAVTHSSSAHATGNTFTRLGRAGIAAFLAGALPIVLGTALIFAALMASHAALASTAGLLAAASLPLAFMEGLVTLFAVGFLRKVAPDMLASSAGGPDWADGAGGSDGAGGAVGTANNAYAASAPPKEHTKEKTEEKHVSA